MVFTLSNNMVRRWSSVRDGLVALAQPRLPVSLEMFDMVKAAGNGPAIGTPSPLAVIEMTGTGIVSSWNPDAVLLYGYPAEEIVGHPADVLWA
jgi:PAS domain-containing protein